MKFKLLIVFTIMSLFIVGCSNKTNNLLSNGFIDNNSEFRFITPEYIEDNYALNLAEDKNEYFKNNVVELTGFVPVSSYEIMINNKALFDLKEMFDTEKYKDLIVRRGFLTNEQSKSQGVNDHKTGYDVDVYVKGKEWTDFEGNKDSDGMIKNSYKYGFVLRYTDKKDYQPYHYRYVGKVHAQIMNGENLTLDEYLKQLIKFKEKQIYQIKNTNTYLYKISKKNLVVPIGYNYSISSINNDYYIVDFNTEKSISIKQIDSYKPLVSKKISDLNILYDLMLVNEDNVISNIPNNKLNLVSLTKYLSNDNNPEYLLTEKVLQQLKPMIDETNKLDRHTTYLTSSYRTYEQQKELYDNGEKGFVQLPNHSEHQTGLAFDLSNSFKPNTGFTETAQGLWVKNNAHKYGFVLRYPQEKVSITGIEHEQWHFRYVGELHATYMKENNIVLEEYLDSFELNEFYNVKFNDKEYVFYKIKTNEDDTIQTFNGNNDIYYLYKNEYLIMSEK